MPTPPGSSLTDAPERAQAPLRGESRHLPQLAGCWLAAFVLAGALYALSANGGAQWQDSGWQQYRITSGRIEHPSGLALAHPLQFWLGRAALATGTARPATAITFVSVVAGAVAIANIFTLITVTWRDRRAAVLATVGLLLAHTFWQFATRTESYTLVIALLSTEWLLLAALLQQERPRGLWLLGLVNGLGVANHLLAALSTPLLLALALWLWRRNRLEGATLAAAAGAWLVGASPYLGLIVADWAAHGNLARSLQSALVGAYAAQVFNVTVGIPTLMLILGYVVYNFPNLTIPAACLARPPAEGRLRPLWWLLLAQLAVYALFAVRYTITDQYTYLLPVYAIVVVLAGGGFARLRSADGAGGRAVAAVALLAALSSPLIYVGAAEAARARGWFAELVRNKPYRDGYRALLVPWGRGEDSPDRLNGQLEQLLRDGGLVVMEDNMQAFAVRYALAAQELPAGLELCVLSQRPTPAEQAAVAETVAAALRAGRSVVLVPHDRDAPRLQIPQARLLRREDVYIVRPMATEAAATQPSG